MDQLERDVEYAEYLIATAKQRPEALISKSSSSSGKGKSLHQKLEELYVEECRRQEDDKGVQYATNLLSKLVRRDKLNCLVLKLYPGNEGYSLMLRGRNGVESETFKLPYEVSELLDYVDASQLPPFLVDLLEKAQVNVFHSGCVIVEVRDYRRSTNGDYDTQHVLLKPTPQSLLSDINNLTNDGHRWTQEDQYYLESQLLLATEEPICLDPSPSVLFIANKLQYEQKNWNSPVIKRSVKRYSQAAVNRKRKFSHAPAPKELRLHDFLHKKKTRSNPPFNLKVGKPVKTMTHVDMWKQRSVQLSTPENVEVEKYATIQEMPKEIKENTFQTVEEITLERDVTADKKILAKLCVKRRTPDDVYFGELYLDHDYKENSQGSACEFTLGTKLMVEKYLQQFKEIFTEEGRKAVKITTNKPGQPAHMEYTQTSISAAPAGVNISGTPALLTGHASTLSAAIRGQVNQLEQPLAGSKSAGVLKQNVPIQLSLTLAPAAPGTQGTQGSNQLQLNIQKPNLNSQVPMASHRNRIGSAQGLGSGQRSSSTPSASPVTTPTSAPVLGQLTSPTIGLPISHDNSKIPLSTATPPPPSPLTAAMATRKHSTDGSTVQQITHGLPQGNITLVQSADANQGQLAQQPGIANINIANLASLPPNINIQNLASIPGMNITNLQGLPNMQVSLTGVSVPGGGIAVPVPISLINSNSGVIQNQGIFVSSLSGISATCTVSRTTASSGVPIGTSNTNTNVTVPSLVTMVTALPSVSSATTVSQLVVTSGAGISTSSVIPSSGGVLSPLIGLPFMSATNLKPQGGTTVRQSTSLPLLQIHGQQGIQFLGLQQQRAPLKPTIQTGQIHPVSKTATSVPTTAVQLTTTNIGGQQVATLSQIKPGQATSGALPQQFLQLQQLQLKQMQQIQLKQAVPQQTVVPGSLGKPKSKKRTTPTPPK